MYQFNRDEYEKRMEWYRDARFGMFIHWGLYSIPARGEWLRSTEEMTIEEYQKYFEEFDARDFKPREWARMAKQAGMKYMVLTAKHHDGFCLFDSKYTEYKATNTKAGRDLVKEYVEAVRAEGLKVGLYFTLLDWYHDDYPHYQDRNHPMRNHPECGNENRDLAGTSSTCTGRWRKSAPITDSWICSGLISPTMTCAGKNGAPPG